MLYTSTLSEVSNNINTGVEYEIALFYKLLKNQPNEQTQVMNAINRRYDVAKVKSIIAETDATSIERALSAAGLELVDASFETQNDEVGPADIVMYVESKIGQRKKIGLSVKYANTCTLNSTSARFITEEQRREISAVYPSYLQRYKDYMSRTYGNASKWHRKRCPVTNEFIDLLRNAVIKNWQQRRDKRDVLAAAFQNTSPIEFWVVTYVRSGFVLDTKPVCIDLSRSDDVVLEKNAGQFVKFVLDGHAYAKMQVKFNNGMYELNLDHRGKRKREQPNEIIDGIEFIYGDPFGSWNFSIIHE